MLSSTTFYPTLPPIPPLLDPTPDLSVYMTLLQTIHRTLHRTPSTDLSQCCTASTPDSTLTPDHHLTLPTADPSSDPNLQLTLQSTLTPHSTHSPTRSYTRIHGFNMYFVLLDTFSFDNLIAPNLKHLHIHSSHQPDINSLHGDVMRNLKSFWLMGSPVSSENLDSLSRGRNLSYIAVRQVLYYRHSCKQAPPSRI